MRRTALCIAAIMSAYGIGGGACHAQQQPATVYLNPSRDWHVAGGKQPWVHILARELTRQAFLLAARDELGLVTRDAWLGDARRPQDNDAPWDIDATAGNPLLVEVVRGSSPQQVTLARHKFRRSGSINYRTWTTEAEALSRTVFVEALKQGGLEGQPARRDASAGVPEHVEVLLGEMNFLSQFQALRELHAGIRSQGESPALLGALVRGYANLGVMTEYYWHPAHKVFKARALLYGQRMVVQNDESPAARWHRAYAAALAGFHAWALADLDAADQAWQALAENDRPPQPAWAQLIGPFCRYEIDALSRHVREGRGRQLAALLKCLAVEQAGNQDWAVQIAVDTLRVIPECYRVHDGLCEFVGVSTGHSATVEPVRLAGERLYGRVRSMPGLPEDIRLIAKDQTSRGGILGALFGDRSYDFEHEFDVRRRLVDALLPAGGPAGAETEDAAKGQAAADSGEPSWAALGLLIRELSFMQTYRRARFERHYLGTPAEEWLATAAPLVEGHPCRAFLETFAWQADKAKDALARLIQVDMAGSEYPLSVFYDLFSRDEKNREVMYEKLAWNGDEVLREIILDIRWKSPTGPYPGMRRLDLLLKLSPYSPLARSLLAEHHWDAVQDKVEQWDKESAPYPELSLALGRRYAKLGRWDDAERCLKAAIKVVPSSLALFRQLASIYQQQGQTDRWLATMEEYLKQPDHGLGHFAVQSEIAQHFMDQKQWKKALPYAEGAAESYSGWGLIYAAACNEALQRWDEAEDYYRACSERYRNSSLHWYFFCRRTGEGNLDEARRLAHKFIKNHDRATERSDPHDLISFYLLEGEPEKALAETDALLSVPQMGYGMIFVALIADQLKDTKKRDEILDRVRSLHKETAGSKNAAQSKSGGDDAAALPNAAVALANLIVKDLAEGGQGQIDLDAADKLGDPLFDNQQLSFRYLLAHYLDLHGQRGAAQRYWKRCMGSSTVAGAYRTLAGAALLEDDIGPADYKTLLQPDTEESNEMKDED